MLWSEVPSIINRNGCFFWRPPSTKFRRQHWIGGRGGHNLYGVVLHGVAVFFEEPGPRKDTIGLTHGCRQMQEWWRHCVRESIGISFGGCVCVWVCLFACACVYVPKWAVLRGIQRQSWHLRDLIPQCRGVHWLAVMRGRRATLRAWLLYPTRLPCNAHATHRHATHMQHTCNTTCNMGFLPVNLQSTCRIWRLQPQLWS